ncbi:hypothetical protein J2Z21_009011 [Streptomyces griseochromogenes]|uniref:Uncharacterized protein n=1 Tax=Streptomyces griseochromogenes TaxID=68214 RepID=A0ABS4M8I9_9ACTN|nr:hypothetical protein [Streptomyces griseochromogenes]
MKFSTLPEKLKRRMWVYGAIGALAAGAMAARGSITLAGSRAAGRVSWGMACRPYVAG